MFQRQALIDLLLKGRRNQTRVSVKSMLTLLPWKKTKFMGLVLLLESRDYAGNFIQGETHQNRVQVHPKRGELLVLGTRKGHLFAIEKLVVGKSSLKGVPKVFSKISITA